MTDDEITNLPLVKARLGSGGVGDYLGEIDLTIACPCCGLTVCFDTTDCVILHTIPTCHKFDQLDAVSFVTWARAAELQLQIDRQKS